MSFGEKEQGREEARVEEALRNFRASVHAWGDREFNRPRTVRRVPLSGFFRVIANPVLAWALAGVLVAGGVGVPVSVHRQRQVAAQEKAALEDRERRAAEEKQRQTELAMDDEELLSHVDSDISQTTPDAMEPLASMMRDTSTK